MTQDITKLKTKNWQHKRSTVGGVVQGIEDIKQCIHTICALRKGSIPFMPLLGSEIIEAIGENSGDSIDIIRAILIKELPKQEPRAEIIDVTAKYNDNGEIKVTVYFREKQTGITDKTEVIIK